MHLECPQCRKNDRTSEGFKLDFSMLLTKDIGVKFDNFDLNLYFALLSNNVTKYDRYIQNLYNFNLECRSCGYTDSAFMFIVNQLLN